MSLKHVGGGGEILDFAFMRLDLRVTERCPEARVSEGQFIRKHQVYKEYPRPLVYSLQEKTEWRFSLLV